MLAQVVIYRSEFQKLLDQFLIENPEVVLYSALGLLVVTVILLVISNKKKRRF